MNCTILIPTYKRDTLEKTLRYYNEMMQDTLVIIGDSSPSDKAQQNKMLVESLHNENIRYIQYDETTSLPKKLSLLGGQATTDYVVYCNDDDILVKEGLQTCTTFLENNQDYVCCGGLIYEYSPRTGRLSYWNDPNSPILEEYHTDPYQRFKNHFTISIMTILSVTKKEVFIKSFNECDKYLNNFIHNPHVETLQGFLISIYGNIKHLNVFYYIKCRHPHSLNDYSTKKEVNQFNKVDCSDDFHKIYLAMRKCLVDNLPPSNEPYEKVIDKLWKQLTYGKGKGIQKVSTNKKHADNNMIKPYKYYLQGDSHLWD